MLVIGWIRTCDCIVVPLFPRVLVTGFSVASVGLISFIPFPFLLALSTCWWTDYCRAVAIKSCCKAAKRRKTLKFFFFFLLWAVLGASTFTLHTRSNGVSEEGDPYWNTVLTTVTMDRSLYWPLSIDFIKWLLCPNWRLSGDSQWKPPTKEFFFFKFLLCWTIDTFGRLFLGVFVSGLKLHTGHVLVILYSLQISTLSVGFIQMLHSLLKNNG